ncbi:MAG: DNA polymerase III subunit delta [Acidobacteria bacterium]|nr:DNA polymerase III subunit delta [Acidobacteriota bacterium]
MPALSVDALRKHYKTGALAPIYLLVGDDSKLISQLVDGIEATIDEADRAFSVERIYALEPGATPVDIIASARTPSMLGGPRIVVVMRAERIFKPKRGGKAAEAEEADDKDTPADDAGPGEAVDLGPIEDYLAAPVDGTTLVFVASDVDGTRKLTKRLKDAAQVVECFGLETRTAGDRREALNAARAQVQKELEQLGRSIESNAMQLLLDRTGLDITQLRGSLERLLLYSQDKKSITIEDVREVVGEHAFVDDWAIINAIGDGDAGRALRALALRFERGDSPHGIVGQLRWWVSSKLAEAEPDRVRPALEALLRTDLALKSSGGEQRLLLERLIVEITGKALPRSGWR